MSHEFTTTDPIAFVREHPSMFLWNAVADPGELASRVAAAALLFSPRVVLSRVNEWWLIASEDDWLKTVGLSPFSQLVSEPSWGPNTFRPEVLLTAFASHVWAGDEHSYTVIKGSVTDVDVGLARRSVARSLGRIVGFRVH